MSRAGGQAHQRVISAAHRKSLRSVGDSSADPSTIRLVSQLEALDPFDDPFGDRVPPPAPITLQGPEPPVELPTSLTSQPDTIRERQPAGEAAPQPPGEDGDGASSADCDRVYNERDCCAAEQSCKTARDYLRSTSLRDISIDITPQFTVGISHDGETDYASELELKLAEAPSRLWRNQRGAVLADGHLVDFRDGRIIVRQADETTVRIPFNDLSEDDICFVTAWWSIPSECTMGDDSFAGRNWIATTMTWKASALCHKPLYFEDVQLERYGHSAGPFVQPFMSGAHFFMNVAALPYRMGINPPNECRYALGYYRPGNCAPWLLPPIPLSVRAALVQAATITGGIYVIP